MLRDLSELLAPGSRSRAESYRRLGELAVCGALPLIVLSWYVWSQHRIGLLGLDFRVRLDELAPLAQWESPYPTFPYPPVAAFVLLPFRWLPSAELVYTALVIACIPLSLRALGVRDWRCYGVAVCWSPVLSAIQTGNLTLPLLLAASLAWRWRERPVPPGLSLALGIGAKLVLWPLALWLAATGRRLAALASLAGAAVISVALWSLISFDGMWDYPAHARRLDEEFSGGSYAVSSLLERLSVGSSFATASGLALGLSLLVGCWLAGRRGADHHSFAIAMLAAIFVTPIVWLHSFALLLGVVAVMSPTLSIAWLVPLAYWLVSTGSGHGTVTQHALTLVVTALAAAIALSSWSGAPGRVVDGRADG